jgi:DNA-binding MarR family transcriptional regulator
MINKFNQIEGEARNYGTGAALFPSEIHLIESIGQNPGVNVTELAELQGISKAAVSQKLRKIEEKNLVARFQDPDNNKHVLLKLTVSGEVAFNGHQQFHAAMDQALVRKINDLTPDMIKELDQLLDDVIGYADSLLREKSF